jgi:hypothetical protein
VGHPGVNPSHVAALGTRFSGVARDGNIIGSLGRPGTITNTPSLVIDKSIGAATKFASSTDAVTFSGLSAANDTTFTSACIFVANSSIANGTLLSTSSNGSGGYRFGPNSLVPVVAYNGAAAASSGVTLVAGIPYFVVVSYDTASGVANFTVTRLDNGKTVAASASSVTGTLANSGTISIGTRVSSNLVSNSSIAAIMWSFRLLSLQQQAKWAADPWSFWYPRG